ncbi:MAG TPA: MFS transporter [Dokdonella sp.]
MPSISSSFAAPLAIALTAHPTAENQVELLPGMTAKRRSPLSPGVTFFLLASITISFLAGSSAPTPLYGTYQAAWGFSPIVVTVIFGIYAVAVLVALLFAGRLSDHLGRRPVLLATIAAQALTMLLFATAGSVTQLLVARVLQGLAAGAAVAAVGAGMLDLDRTRGTVANAVAPAFGTATGAILAGLMVQYLPAPTHLIYAFLGGVLILQGIGVALMDETISPQPGALASLKPRFRLPAATREPLLLAIPILVASWALAGFYGSLGPMLVRGMMGSNSPLLGGLALFALASSAGVSVLALQHRAPRAMMSLGAVALIAGVGISMASLPSHAIGMFFLGTVIAGAGFGAGFQGGVRTILPFAEPHERAGVLSLIFIVSYLAMGLPAVIAGVFVARHGDILATAQGFGTVVIALAALALVGSTLRSATK